MGSSPRGYPWPETPDPALIPADVEAAVTAIDTDVQGVDDGLQVAKTDIVALGTDLDAAEVRVGQNETDIAALESNATVNLLVQSGVVTVTFSNSATASKTVTFPTPYSSLPNVVVSTAGSASASYRGANTEALSTSTVQIVSRTHSDGAASGDIDVQWIAVGPA